MEQTITEPSPQESETDELLHGYPPPVRPAGATVTAYCGIQITVRGESSPNPPQNTCPRCADIWQKTRKRRR